MRDRQGGPEAYSPIGGSPLRHSQSGVCRRKGQQAMPEVASTIDRSQIADREARWPDTEFSRVRQQEPSIALPARITRHASKQAYYTIRLLADRDRRLDAYRAYAYFRWVDDWLDQPGLAQSERLDYIQRQQWLVRC